MIKLESLPNQFEEKIILRTRIFSLSLDITKLEKVSIFVLISNYKINCPGGKVRKRIPNEF